MKNLPLGRLGVGGRCVGGIEVLFFGVGTVVTAWSIFSVDRGNPIDLAVGLLGRFSSWGVKLVTMIHQCGKGNTTHNGLCRVFKGDQG